MQPPSLLKATFYQNHEKYLKQVIKIYDIPPGSIKFCITGSYRRGKVDSGDIDVLFTCKDKKKFDKFVDKLYQAGVAELKTIENIDYGTGFVTHEDQGQDTEDTLTLLSKYIDETETTVDKSRVKNLLQNVYQQACEVT